MRFWGFLTGMAMLVASASWAGNADFGVTGVSTAPAPVAANADRPADWNARNAAVLEAAKAGAAPIAAPPGAIPAPSTLAYTLGPGDKVRLTVFGEEDLSGEFQVDNTGVLSIPLVGDVNVGGKTMRDAEKMVTAKLSDGYLVNPRVNLEVLNFRPFFILGEVKKPGSYPCINDLTVINAVATAEGYTTRAKTGHVLIKRAAEPEKGEQEAAEDARVMPGDVIRVEERFF